MYIWNHNCATLANGSQCFTFLTNGFLTLQLQENIFQGCPANLIINNPLQKTALEMAEQVCKTETDRFSPVTEVSVEQKLRPARLMLYVLAVTLLISIT